MALSYLGQNPSAQPDCYAAKIECHEYGGALVVSDNKKHPLATIRITHQRKRE